MKSFFKKLAFVMAMAMVVSLAAPAAAQAADLPLYLAYQNETDKVEGPVVLAPEATVDFCFHGAKEGWRDLERGWVSSNPAVATVDSNGLVTAVAAGVATITFKLAGYEDASVQVVVAEPKATNDYELTQATEKAFKLTYADDVKYTVEDVQLFVLYENEADEEPIKVKWPVDKKNSKVEKNVITVCPFVEFADGQKFLVVVDGVEKDITVEIGEVTDVVVKLVQSSPEVFANVEDDDDFYLSYTVQYLSNGVDLTNHPDYKELDLDWVITSTNEDATDFDKDEAKLYFYEKDITANVQAIVTLANKKEIKSIPVPAYSIDQPEWKLVGVTDWVVIDKDTTVFDWSKSGDYKSVPADVEEEEYIIVLKLVDSRKKEYVTYAGAIDKDKKLEVFDIDDFEISFFSADTDLMLVDEEGYIGVYKETEAVFYVQLSDDSGENEVTKYIYADTLAVTEGRRLDTISIKDNKTSLEVVTKTLEGYEDLLTAFVEMEAKDQYKTACSENDIEVTYTVDTDNDKVDEKKAVKVVGNKITVDGGLLAGLGVSSFKVTVTGVQAGCAVKPTATFVVEVKNPKIVSEKVVEDTVTKTRYNTYKEVLIEVKDIDINAEKSGDGDMYASITLYRTSNDAIVGKYVEGDLMIATSKADTESAQFTTEGARYVVITKGDKYYTPFWADVDGDGVKETLQLQLAEAGKNGDAREMNYGETGTYNVKVVTVRYKKDKDGVSLQLDKRNDYDPAESMVVSNGTPDVSFSDRKKDTFEEEDIKKIVVETLAFTRGGKAWTITADMIDEVDTVEVGDYIIIKSVKFHVPIDGVTTAGSAPYYTKTVSNINVSVKKAD